MRASIFSKHIEKRFDEYLHQIGKEENEYDFKKYFEKKYSSTSHPYSHEFPKIGMKMQLREGEINNLAMIKRWRKKYRRKILRSERIDPLLFGPLEECLKGVYSPLDQMAMQALSQGKIERPDFKMDFHLPQDNKLGVSTGWDDPQAQPLNDIEKVLKAAANKGRSLSKILMSREDIKRLKENRELRSAPIKSFFLKDMNEYFSKEYGLTIELVGPLPLEVWPQGRIIFLTEGCPGDLIYSDSIESIYPIEGVVYRKVDDYILVSRFGRMDPLMEVATAQTRAIPVLKDPQGIYQLNTLKATW